MGLFGGAVKFSSSRDKVPVRGDPHVSSFFFNELLASYSHISYDLARHFQILIVGDPGLGKSQMLTSCASVAPRGVFVTATGATSSGLTVTLTRESNEFVLEGGALVLADRGACCIDEFDKMTGHQVRRTKMHRICVTLWSSVEVGGKNC